MTLEDPGFDGKRKWKCLDGEGEIIGHVSGANPQDAINSYIIAATNDPFQRNVHTLVCGTIRLNVENLVIRGTVNRK